MAAAIFVAARLWDRKSIGPKRRRIHSDGGMDALEHCVRDADVGDLDRSAVQPTRQLQVAGFPAKERHGVAGVDRSPQHGAAVAVDAAWQIDGDHRNVSRIDGLDYR